MVDTVAKIVSSVAAAGVVTETAIQKSPGVEWWVGCAIAVLSAFFSWWKSNPPKK